MKNLIKCKQNDPLISQLISNNYVKLEHINAFPEVNELCK